MTWTEICTELVKRWPERFEIIYEYPMTKTIRIDTAKWSINEYSVDDITEICTVIGAVVWSAPSWVEGRHDGWYGAHEENDNVVFTVGIYPTRAEAELAALGAWLEATR